MGLLATFELLDDLEEELGVRVDRLELDFEAEVGGALGEAGFE